MSDVMPASGKLAMAAPRPLQIPGSMDRLGGCTERLADRVAALADRLAPVLRPHPPMPAPEGPASATEHGSAPAPLVAGVHMQADRVDTVVQVVEDLLDRLEL